MERTFSYTWPVATFPATFTLKVFEEEAAWEFINSRKTPDQREFYILKFGIQQGVFKDVEFKTYGFTIPGPVQVKIEAVDDAFLKALPEDLSAVLAEKILFLNLEWGKANSIEKQSKPA